MKRNIQTSLLAGTIAMALAAGTAMATAPERDPGQQSPTTQSPTSSTMQSKPATSASDNTASSTKRISASDLAPDKFAALDANGDGSVDKQEARASSALTAEFSKLDKNHDGKLSLTEFSAAKNMASIKSDKSGVTRKKSAGYQP